MMKIATALCFTLVICGCSDQYVARDAWKYQPYIGPGHTAEGTATIKTVLIGQSGNRVIG